MPATQFFEIVPPPVHLPQNVHPKPKIRSYITNTLFSTTTNIVAKMAPPNGSHYRAERHHHFHKMQNRNGVGRDSNFRNRGERGWNGDRGRVSSVTSLSDSVDAPFLTIT